MKDRISAEKEVLPGSPGPSANLEEHTRLTLERKQGKEWRSRSRSGRKPIEQSIDRSQEHFQLTEVVLLSRMLAYCFWSVWALGFYCWEENLRISWFVL